MSRLSTVIGASGYIGQALVRHLQTAGHDIWAPSRDTQWPVTRPLGTVYYCAGMTADFLARPAQTLAAHVVLVEQVLSHCSWENLVYLSSTRLYDALTASDCAQEDLHLAINPGNPRHFYDLTKLLGENLCLTLGQGRARVARLGCVYDFSPSATGFLPSVLAQVKAHQGSAELTLDSSPHFSRDYVHLEDTVRGLIEIATRGTHGVYNLASGQNLRNDELAAWIAKHTGVAIHFNQSAVVQPPATVSMDRFLNEFGWRPANFAEAARMWSALPQPSGAFH